MTTCIGGYGTDDPCANGATEERITEGLAVHLCARHAHEFDTDSLQSIIDAARVDEPGGRVSLSLEEWERLIEIARGSKAG